MGSSGFHEARNSSIAASNPTNAAIPSAERSSAGRSSNGTFVTPAWIVVCGSLGAVVATSLLTAVPSMAATAAAAAAAAAVVVASPLTICVELGSTPLTFGCLILVVLLPLRRRGLLGGVGERKSEGEGEYLNRSIMLGANRSWRSGIRRRICSAFLRMY